MSDINGDLLGLAIDHRETETDFCIGMMMAISAEMHDEGITGVDSIPEFKARCIDVMARRRDCPAVATCQKYRKAVLERNRPDRFGIFGERPAEWIQNRMILEE